MLSEYIFPLIIMNLLYLPPIPSTGNPNMSFQMVIVLIMKFNNNFKVNSQSSNKSNMWTSHKTMYWTNPRCSKLPIDTIKNVFLLAKFNDQLQKVCSVRYHIHLARVSEGKKYSRKQNKLAHTRTKSSAFSQDWCCLSFICTNSHCRIIIFNPQRERQSLKEYHILMLYRACISIPTKQS